MKEHRNFSSLKWTGEGVEKDEMKWNEIVKESKMINTKQIISWYTIAKGMVQRVTNTCIFFRNIAAKQVEKRYARFTANRVQIRYWTSLYLTFNKLYKSRTSPLSLRNCHFLFTYKEDEKTKFLVFLSKLFSNLHFSSVSNRWKRGHLFVFPHVLPFDDLLTWTELAHFASKIQLVVYYQCCVFIGWATTRLYVIAH